MSLLPRILAGVDGAPNDDPRSDLGALPDLSRWAPDRLIDEVERSGLRGRGGAAFPVARKMHAVAARRGPRVLVGNGTEGEPASGKDRLLLTELPHLVLDGAAMAARAVGADTAIIAFAETDQMIARSLAPSGRRAPGSLAARPASPDTSCAPSTRASSQVRSPLWSTRFRVESQSPASGHDRSSAACGGGRR